MFLPIAFIFAVVFIWQGSPMTLQSAHLATTLEPGSMGLTDKGAAIQQNIVVGPVAAFESMKMLGTNGGGFYGMNSAHPFENPTALSNFFNTLEMMIFPFALVLMFGRMLKRMKHAVVIFSVMLTLMVGVIVWVVAFDTLKPNPGLTSHASGRSYDIQSAGAPGGKVALAIPGRSGIARRPAPRQSGRQGHEVRDLGGSGLRRPDHRCHLRRR